MRALLRQLWPVLFIAWPEISIAGAKQSQINAADPPYVFDQGVGLYRVQFNYTGKHWTHADVAAIVINTDKPIAVLPMQYTGPTAMQPGAQVDGKHIGKDWNTITQRAMAIRLEALGFFVLTPTITHYGEDLPGFQALEHFIAGVHKGNDNVQTVLLTADADTPNPQNPVPGAQMLVTGTHPRNKAWEALLQAHMGDFYTSVKLNNLGARVRGGLSDEEGSSAAWHPLIERAAEYGSEVAIIEVARAVDIVARAGSIEHGEDWAAPLFDALADAMLAWTQESKTESLQ
ncbi:MAG: hypothetical protein ACR2PD_05330 [Luminiphilus sp.]